MAFLSPLLLLGAAAAAVPILLHLLKRQPEARVRFAAVRLLTAAPIEHSRKRFLRELILLALRVAALVLLAVAFARPFLSASQKISSGVTVVALDTSLSMSSPGTFERARSLAKDALSRAPRTDLVGVILFSDTARVVAPASGDRALAASAVDTATARFGATRYAAALEAAGQLVAARGDGHGTIVLVTDLQQSGWDATAQPSLPEAVRLEIADARVPVANLAVTAVETLPDRTSALVHNFGDATREARVRLVVDGRSIGEARATLTANQSSELLLPAAKGRSAQVSVDDSQGITGDNVRYAVLDGGSGSNVDAAVLVVTANGDLTRDAFYLQEALRVAGRDGNRYRAVGANGSQLSAWDAARVSAYSAVVLISTRGIDSRARSRLRNFVQSGGGLFVTGSSDVDGAVVADILGNGAATLADAPAGMDQKIRRALVPVDVRHPLMRAFGTALPSMSLVNFTKLSRLNDGGRCARLARFTTGEDAIVECDVDQGRVLMFASDLEGRGNDWPLKATFVPFVHEAVRYLTGGRRSSVDYLVSEVPAGIPAEPGVFAAPGANGRLVAVNVDPRESDPARLSAGDVQQAVARWQTAPSAGGAIDARDEEERQHLWQYAMIAVALLLAAESLVAAKAA